MPKLNTVQVKKVYLPSTEAEVNEDDKAWVLMKDRLLTREFIALGQGETETDRMLLGLVEVITDWNFTVDGTPTGEKVEIDVESVARLESGDFQFLTNQLNSTKADNLKSDVSVEQKKTSTDTSTQDIAVEIQV